mmetsp:Transcript_95418/g.302836  ORF Transcript_95418/g.302836 Transcript_95418/m.302836 type:complete len:329 (+) Transcript_95418:383-1369(+)
MGLPRCGPCRNVQEIRPCEKRKLSTFTSLRKSASAPMPSRPARALCHGRLPVEGASRLPCELSCHVEPCHSSPQLAPARPTRHLSSHQLHHHESCQGCSQHWPSPGATASPTGLLCPAGGELSSLSVSSGLLRCLIQEQNSDIITAVNVQAPRDGSHCRSRGPKRGPPGRRLNRLIRLWKALYSKAAHRPRHLQPVASLKALVMSSSVGADGNAWPPNSSKMMRSSLLSWGWWIALRPFSWSATKFAVGSFVYGQRTFLCISSHMSQMPFPVRSERIFSLAPTAMSCHGWPSRLWTSFSCDVRASSSIIIPLAANRIAWAAFRGINTP